MLTIEQFFRRSIFQFAVPSFRCRVGPVGLLFCCCLAVLDLPPCPASQPPTLAELRAAHAALRAAVIDVQGTVQVYRAESEIPAAFEQLPSELGIPLLISGNVWRGKSRFRGDYTTESSHGDTQRTVVQSVARDDGTVFKLSGSPDDKIGTLYVCDVGAPESAEIENVIEGQFYHRLDALWRGNGVPFIDLLQRPGAEIAATSRTLQPGISLLVPFDEGIHDDSAVVDRANVADASSVGSDGVGAADAAGPKRPAAC